VNITDLEVDGFGTWTGLKLKKFSDRVTVIYGPNEAGKTTLMQWIRAALFGFTSERRARYLPPVRGGRPGGKLLISSHQGKLIVTRHDEPGNTVSGRLAVLDNDGKQRSSTVLDALLSGVDESIFKNVFAVGMREMQELGALNDTAAGDLLYRLATGVDRVSLVDVVRELDASRQRLVAADGKSSQISQLLGERDRLRGEIERLQQNSGEYAQLVSQRDDTLRQAAVIEAELTAAQQHVKWIELASSLRERYQKRQALSEELEPLLKIPAVPEGIWQRLEEINARLAKRRKMLSDSVLRRKNLRREAQQLEGQLAVQLLAPRVEAIVEQQPWLATLETRIKELRAEIEELQTAPPPLPAKKPSEKPALPPPPPITPELVERVRPLMNALRQTRHHVHEAQEQEQKARQVVTNLRQQMAPLLRGRNEEDLPEAIEKAGILVSTLRRRVQVDERLEQLSRHAAVLNEQRRDWADRQMLPVRMLVWLGGFFVVGVALILAGLLLPTSFVGPTGWVLTIVGLASTATGVGAKMILERNSAIRLESSQRQARSLNAQLEEVRKDRDELDGQIPRGGGPMLARLQAAERDHAALEELLPLGTKVHAAEEEVAAAEQVVATASKHYRRAIERWREALRQAGLSEKLRPQDLIEAAQKAPPAAPPEPVVVIRDLPRLQAELAARQRDLAALRTRIGQLLTEANIVPTTTDPTEQLSLLRKTLSDAQARVAQRTRLKREALKLRREHVKLRKQLRHVLRERRHALHTADVLDEAALRERLDHLAYREHVQKEHDELTHELLAALHPHHEEHDLRQYLDQHSIDDTATELAELAEQRQIWQRELQQLAELRGRCQERLRACSEDRELASRWLDLGAIEEQLRAAIERWQVLGVTHRLLQSIRRNYESQRQPEALREASQYLAQLTHGQYVRVWTPLDEDVLRVDNADGQALSVDVLSRGTREQVYLSLRLALVSAYARRGARLPLILDDVLVNFDGHRAEMAAEVLRDFAADGHQILLFTCHEHIVRVFRSLNVPTIVLPANTELNAEAEAVTSLPRPAPQPIVMPRVIEPEKPSEPPKPVEPVQVIEPVVPAPPPLPLPQPVVELPPPEPVAQVIQQAAPAPVQTVTVAAPEPEPTMRAAARRRPKRVRRRRMVGPFATATWHEPVEEEVHEFLSDNSSVNGSTNGAATNGAVGTVRDGDEEIVSYLDDESALLEQLPVGLER
jgi:uncharacterized protein YhaN